MLGVNIGMFYKRRDYSVIVNGKNPIVAHEFLGDNIDGKDIVIVDDMISSGGSMLDTARQLKEMNARRVFICTTFVCSQTAWLHSMKPMKRDGSTR